MPGKEGFPSFRILSDEQCSQIHDASLRILSRTGIRVMDSDTVELLHGAGAEVESPDTVRFPEHMVQSALEAAPHGVDLHHRDGSNCLHLQGRNVYFGTGSDCPYILDPFTGERRKFLKADVAQGIRLCDALENIDFVLSIGLISDVPTAVSDVHQFDAMVRNTVKPVVFTAHGAAGCSDIIEMAEIVAGGADVLQLRPTIAAFVETNPPLQFGARMLSQVTLMSERGLPVVFSSGALMGASGPQTHAGIIALSNAENLAGNVIVQLRRRGAPFVYAQGVHPLDMRTMVLPYGAPELSLNTAAAADLAQYYGLPVWGYAGCSDAKVVDQQAAMEATASVVMSILSGSNLVHDVGYVESGLTSSFDMIVLSDVAIEMARSMLKPIVVSEETLALDLIDKVGQGGSFLAEDHTYRHFRNVWYSDLVDRWKRGQWEASGQQTMGDRLNRHVRQVLESHAPEPLPDDQLQGIDEVLSRAELRSSV